MKILVTGGCGYIGSHVVRQLSVWGHEVVVVDNLSTGFAQSLLHGEQLIEGDFGDPTILEKALGGGDVDAVMHFAASIVVPESVSDPLKYYRNNTGNTLCLLEAVRRHGVGYFVFSSTAAVYGDPGLEIVDESTATDPQSPYGRSKLMDEWMLKDMAHAYGLHYGILRYFNVAGADPELRIGQRTPKSTLLIKVACEVALGVRDQLVITGSDYPTEDGTGVRDYIHVEDLASAHLKVLDYLTAGGESQTFNCGYGHGYSVRQVVEAMERVLGQPLNVREGARRSGDVARIVADAAKIQKLCGWKPQYDDLDQICRDHLGWEHKLRGIR